MLLAGARRLTGDLATPPRVPAMVEPDAFAVGVDLAALAAVRDITGADSALLLGRYPDGHGGRAPGR
jgi:hypothetical protein